MVYPYLQYCNIGWDSTYPTNLNRIVTLQKRIIRILNNSKLDAHTDPLFKELQLLKFHDICKLQMGQLVFSWKDNLLPKYFYNMFVSNNQIHGYNKRNANTFRNPFCRTKLIQFSLRFQGPKLYNSLPEKVKNIASVSIFVSRLKTFLRSDYFIVWYCLVEILECLRTYLKGNCRLKFPFNIWK